MSMKLYVGGLSYDMTSEDLKSIFEEQGDVASVTIITDRQTGGSRGFGFVEMSNIKEGQKAIKTLNGAEKNGRNMIVSVARESDSPSRRGSFRR